MKFIVDAQLPRRLVYVLRAAGYDAVHTLDLPEKNCTTDDVIIHTADVEDRIVATKDADFVTTLMLKGQPKKLLLISTGNIRNIELEELILTNLSAIKASFQNNKWIELTRTAIIVHM